ncbi:MAG TPA: hypothetical protein PL084_08030 [Chitinophagales bacterium]|nr:hypothetical protein [Chitinophagales bacterium]HRP38456.1 hypothetical protein [Chitinophagales bacterium]
MKRSIFYILIVFTIYSCSDREHLPAPEFLLSFNSSIGNYSEKTVIQLGNNISYKLKPTYHIASTVGNDSIMLIFKSILIDENENLFADLSLSNVYHKNQVDSTEGGWILKNDVDFNSLFALGAKDVSKINFNLQKNGKYYQFVPAITGMSSGVFVIENVFNNVNWLILASQGFLPSGSYRKTIVKFNFNTKLYNAQTNDTILLEDGQFQGLFVDR